MAAATCTEFCCLSGGSNLNAGTRTGNSTVPGTAADFTYVSGSWVAATGVFTVASGNPSSDGVAVGDFASVYADGSTVTGFVGRVTARDATTITVSLTAASGTPPLIGVGNRTLKIGGAWKGPNGTDGFPFTVVTNALKNAAGNLPRVNFKNNQTYSITAALSHASDGPIRWEGFTTIYGDGGRATFDGGTTGAAFRLLNFANHYQDVRNLIFQNNGDSGNANGLQLASGIVVGCVAAHIRGYGLLASGGTPSCFAECEAYDCNQSNTANQAGIATTSAQLTCVNCISHDNAGSNSHGFACNANTSICLINCIAESNGASGVRDNGNGGTVIVSCDFYNNTGSGYLADSFANPWVWISNSNFLKQGVCGTKDANSGPTALRGVIYNCGFGSGTQANAGGDTSFQANDGVDVNGSITYDSNITPWVDPANGDFRINLPAAKGVGRGVFTETATSYTGTVAYPDIGAAQHKSDGYALIGPGPAYGG